ncbi:hypothetical protein [Peribacillus sp. SCS-155]|uniref:hypothetical protein n=1 Tax=Peribacillus sedimenti TaxID=3115297 RepID=UPI0039060152
MLSVLSFYAERELMFFFCGDQLMNGVVGVICHLEFSKRTAGTANCEKDTSGKQPSLGACF